MFATAERAFEFVVLAGAFRDPRGRGFIAEFFPASVAALYDAVTADPRWSTAATLADQALVVAGVLDERPDLAAAYQADVDAGEMGFGAGEDEEVDTAIAQVERALTPVSAGAEVPPAPAPPASSVPPPPPPEAPPGDPDADLIRSWLNAELDDPSAPVQVEAARILSVFFGERSDTAVAAAAAAVPLPVGASTIDLTVEISSADFTVPPFAQQLRLSRDGTSNRALFEITARHEGPSTLTVIVSASGNFVQRLDITFDVGTDAAPTALGRGRPAAAAAVLDARTASLQVTPADWGYELIARQVSPDPIRIEITPVQLAARIDAVRAVLLAAVKKSHVALEMTIPPEDNAALLADLAFAGYRLYQAVFAGNEAGAELRAVGDWLRGRLAEGVSTLQVVSTGFPVPWALMYLTDRFDPAALTWDAFVGMRHIVEQVPLVQLDTVPPPPAIASTPELTVRAVYNETIDQQMPSKPIAAQRAYWHDRGVALTEGTTRADLTAALSPPPQMPCSISTATPKHPPPTPTPPVSSSPAPRASPSASSRSMRRPATGCRGIRWCSSTPASRAS
ncbi:hypothetical protein GCM10025738_13940 [Microbacterium fluvii]